MSAEDAKKFFDLVNSDQSVRDEVKKTWDQVAQVAQKHGLDFSHAEYFDHIHEHTGMTKIGRSHERDDPDTCICVVPSEPPRF